MAEDIEAYVSKLKAVELKKDLKRHGLSTAGVKPVLAQRLQKAMSKEIVSSCYRLTKPFNL